MLGNRGSPKHPMRRTTSLTEFSPPDVLAGVAEEEEEEGAEGEREDQEGEAPYGWLHGAGKDRLAAYRARAAPALATQRRNSADFSAAETASFLRACGLCRRRLGPGRDTFMYRGDTAFCSLECRQQHITREEWKEKCALAAPPPPVGDQVAPASGGSEKSGAGGTLAAA